MKQHTNDASHNINSADQNMKMDNSIQALNKNQGEEHEQKIKAQQRTKKNENSKRHRPLL